MASTRLSVFGERRDDQAARVAQVLVGVRDGRGDHAHYCRPLLEVVAQLRDPGKIVRRLRLLPVQRADHVSC